MSENGQKSSLQDNLKIVETASDEKKKGTVPMRQQCESPQIRLEWDVEMARTWKNMLPPTKPSESEIQIYKSYFKEKKDYCDTVNGPNVLILGSTVELRKLAYELDFYTYIVDYSQEYHDEISKELTPEIKAREHFVQCDWLKMKDNSILKEIKFDIIIGDLAIGNIAPKDLNLFFQNVTYLLKDDGYLLGKSVYKFSDYNITQKKINSILSAAATKIDMRTVFESTVYDLVVFAANKETGKVSFKSLHRIIDEFVEQRNSTRNERLLFDLYLGQSTDFKDKMPENFYVYSFKTIIDNLHDVDLYVADVEYCKDVYKDKFPLLVIKKKEPRINIPKHDISTTIGAYAQWIDEWAKWRSSRFFLSNFDMIAKTKFVKDDCVRESIIHSMKKLIKINNKLNFYLGDISDQSIDNDALNIVKYSKIEKNGNLVKKLKTNYILAILAYESYNTMIADNCTSNDTLESIVEKLFNQQDQNSGLWVPWNVPWVSAKICICLYPLYEQYKKKKDVDVKQSWSMNAEYCKKIETAIGALNSKINEDTLMWDTEIGGRFDTSALCLETLYLYSKQINDNTISETINKILERYVLNDKIFETFIRYPISESLVRMAASSDTKNALINCEAAYKKMCGRIEWYTILYVICKEKKTESNDNKFEIASTYISMQLKRFWKTFKSSIGSIYKNTINLDKSFIPQILYCLQRSGALDDGNNN